MRTISIVDPVPVESRAIFWSILFPNHITNGGRKAPARRVEEVTGF
jgi:hypothetical protein